MSLLQKLIKIGLLTPAGVFYFLRAAAGEGVNLMTLAAYAARRHGARAAVEDGREELSYAELYRQSRRLAEILRRDYGLGGGKKAAVMCRSHAALLRGLFAASRCGASVFLLNPEMSRAQFAELNNRRRFDFLIYDRELAETIGADFDEKNSLAAYHDARNSVAALAGSAASEKSGKMPRGFGGEIVVLTGGTTGTPKTAARKSSIFNFLNPFFALLTELNLDAYRTVYIATPLYHGFGIAAVFISMVLGSRMFLRPRFEAAAACRLIEDERVEVVTVVPLMLQRMLDCDARALEALQRIITGGAAITPALVTETLAKLGDVLYNLYGTSEAGFSVIATPEALRRAPDTIGRSIRGVRLAILDADDQPLPDGQTGRLCIQSRWAVKAGSKWVETGDLGYRDAAGCLFLRGRSDEMIVSGGENVYPIELENALSRHPAIRQVAVIGIPDKDFGQRLKAFVVPAGGAQISPAEIHDWLASRVARFQMPAAIEMLDELPLTSVGKINKKALRQT